MNYSPGRSRLQPSPNAVWNARLLAERGRLNLSTATATVDWEIAASLFKQGMSPEDAATRVQKT